MLVKFQYILVTRNITSPVGQDARSISGYPAWRIDREQRNNTTAGALDLMSKALTTTLTNVHIYHYPYHLVKLLNDSFEGSNPLKISSLPYCLVSSLIHLNSNPAQQKTKYVHIRLQSEQQNIHLLAEV